MKILSFDQSSTNSGYCLYDTTAKTIITSGAIDKHKIKNTDERVMEMGVAICKKIKELSPDFVTIEHIQNQSNTATVILLARLQGFIIGWCYTHKIRVEIMEPAKWRSQLSFKQGPKVKRDELKQQAVDYVQGYFGIDDCSVDECEAICMVVAASKLWGE